jgi:drug/metabolite transporter (DMT)-like permease
VGRILSSGLDSERPATLDPATAAWLRYAVVVVMFFVWCTYKSLSGGRIRALPPDRITWVSVLWIGFFGVMIYQLLFMHGMKWTAAGDASLIIPINPVFTALLAAPMLGQPISRKMALGLLLGMAGVTAVVGWSPNVDIPFKHRIVGDAMIMLAALSWATTSNLTKRIMERRGGEAEASALEIVIWYSFVGWLMLTPWMLYELWGSPLPAPTVVEWVSIVYLGAFSTVLAYVWFAIGIERLGPTAAASYVFLVPVFGVMTGWGLLGERIGASMLVGFALIVVGVREVQRESERLEAG